MTIKSTAVTVTTDATRLDTVVEGADHNQISTVALFNNGAATIFIGGADVTTANGYPVAATTAGPTSTDVDTSEGVYGIVATGTAEMRVYETGV